MKYKESFTGIIKDAENNEYEKNTILVKIKEGTYVNIDRIEEFKDIVSYFKLYQIISLKK